MKAKWLLALSAIALATVFVAGRATLRIKRNKAEELTLTARNAGLREKAGRFEQRLHEANAAMARLGPLGAPTAVESSGPGATGERSDNPLSVPTGNEARLSPQTRIANNPQMMGVYLAAFRETLDMDHGGMFRALGLSPAQIERFKEMQVALLASKMDLQAAIETQALDPNGTEARKLLADWQRLRAAKEADVLGDGIERYREYNRMRDGRDLAKSLAWTSVYAGEALAFAQVEQTAQILTANSPRGPVEGNSINWEAARDRLKGVLSPSQIATLTARIEQIARDEKVNQQINQRVATLTAQFKAQPPAK